MQKNAVYKLLFFGSLLLLLHVVPARAQQSRSVQIGRTLFSTNEVMSGDDIMWPQGVRDMADDRREMLESAGLIVGTRRPWSDPTGNTWPVQVAQVAHNRFSDIRLVTVPEKGAFKRVFRNPFPTKILDGQNWVQLFDREDAADPSIPSDAVIYLKMKLWPEYGMGMEVERWTYAFADQAHQDIILQEYVLTNTSTEPRNDVYLALTSETIAHAHYPGDLWGNYYGKDYRDYVAGNPNADSLRLWYAWDANRIHERPQEDSRGHPHSQWGHFEEPQAYGFMVLHADRSATDESDDPAQPYKGGWSQRELSPDLNVANQQAVYDFISSPWAPNPGDGTYALLDATGMYRYLNPEFDTNSFRPNEEQEKNALFSFGPYTLAPGQDVRVVVAYVGGMIPQRLAIDAGRAFKNGATSQYDLVPLPAGRDLYTDYGHHIVRNGDVYDLQGNLIARAGETLTTEQKNQILDLSNELVFYAASRAVRTWKSGNVKKGAGSFNIDYAPASPSVEGYSEGDRIRLLWSDNTQDTRGGAPVAWRIYREYKRPPAMSAPTDTTFLLLAEVPAGQTEYLDQNVVRGEQYYYYITAVNSKGIESSAFQNKTGVSATKQDEALVPRQPAESTAWQDKIVVVPNPFHIQGTRKYSDRRLNFLNLPPYARIHIYTVTGDRIQTIEHDVNAGDEDWQRQDTFSQMEIVSGVYLYVVEKLEGPGGEPNGEKAIGKFVVIK